MDFISFSSENMKLNVVDSVPFLTYNVLSDIDFITHAFSTKYGGVSTGEFATMNLAFNRGDNKERVTENYKRLAKAVGVKFESMVASAQDHNTVVRLVTSKNIGIGITKPKDMESVDALITNEPGVTLVTYYADCTPMFFVDTKTRAIALAHGGWRGTVERIAEKVVMKMKSEFATKPENLIVAVGPAISKCCYEVDFECYRNFAELDGIENNKIATQKDNGKYMLDLLETNKQILLNSGVLQENIIISDVCTMCNSNLLWSHRATGGKRGTMAAVMAIKGS